MMMRGGQRSMVVLMALCVLVAIPTIRDTGTYYKYTVSYHNSTTNRIDEVSNLDDHAANTTGGIGTSATTISTTTKTSSSSSSSTVSTTVVQSSSSSTSSSSSVLDSVRHRDQHRHRHRGVVYNCGYDYHLDQAFGPEYQSMMGPPPVPLSTEANATTTPHDILIYGLYGSCPTYQIEEGADVIDSTITLLRNFPGKILIVNGESNGNVFDVIKAATMTSTSTDRRDGNKYNNEMKIAGQKLLQLIRNRDGTVGTRLYQIGPYPPIIPTIKDRKVMTTKSTSNNTTHDDDIDDDMYVSLYNSHSLQVFHMALFMNKVFGPPPLLPSFSSVSQSTVPMAMTIPSNNANSSYSSNSSSYNTTSDNSDSIIIHYDTNIHTILNNNIQIEVASDPIWDWWIDPKQRRNNTRKYNAIAYFTRNCIPHRQRAARQLASIIPVHYPARVGGCTVLPIPGIQTVPIKNLPPRNTFASNYVLFHNYKYCLVMENTQQDGYVTEKIANAYLGGCLPIYYGTNQIWDIFHNESFIFYDIHNPQPAMDLLRQLEADPEEYHRRLQDVPILKEGHKTMQRYFSLLLKPTMSSSSSISSSPPAGENGEIKSSSLLPSSSSSSSLSSLANPTTVIVSASTEEETLNGRIRKMMGLSLYN